jgi:hypothetical protein
VEASKAGTLKVIDRRRAHRRSASKASRRKVREP